jgi:NADH-ubiquinone oxidoreductase chain 6
MKNIFIDILAFGTILSSILVITSKNPVIAVIYLIAAFCNAAGYLLLLGIGFIGISYIIVYCGAITVLFLFVIMMLNIKIKDILETGSQYTKNIPLALIIGSLFVYELFNILPFTLNDISAFSILLGSLTNLNRSLLNSDIPSINAVFNIFDPNIADIAFINSLQIEAIGQALYTSEGIFLIILSIVLLLSMIAPILISRNFKKHIDINPFHSYFLKFKYKIHKYRIKIS